MAARREQLLDLAERVLEREGLAGFGVNALAREAGIKPPSIYKHFAGAADLRHALISRWFRRLAAALDAAEPSVAAFAAAYRAVALDAPQLYRLATDGPLDRALLEPGAERAAMAATLRLFGEGSEGGGSEGERSGGEGSEGGHPRSRLAWAAAHGLVSLEIAGRFPAGTDLDAAWRTLSATLSG
ncbi:TetR/AcrR family transcriptional regulator [Leucobacter sp.]